MSPVAKADGHDAPGLAGQPVPRLAAMGDDVVVGAEDLVGEPVVPQELPDIFLRVQFRRTGWQRQKGNVAGHFEPGRHMPSGLVEHNDRMRAGVHRGADLVQMRLHGGRVAPGHDEAGAFAFRRADGAENVSPLRALILRRTGPGSTPRPAAGYLVLLPDPGFVLEPDFYFDICPNLVPDRRQLGGEVFLNSSMASAFCA